MPTEVHLEWHEVELAAQVGLRRHLSSLRDGRKDQHGYDGSNGWTIHIEGAAGELAFAKYMGLYWDGSCYQGSAKNFCRPDVGVYHVRTRSEHWHDLLIRPMDPIRATYVLVTGRIPDFQVHGKIYGEDLVEDWLMDYGNRPPAYFVPQDALHGF